ncbi:unnamed protein product, partial [Laminaria digitata]
VQRGREHRFCAIATVESAPGLPKPQLKEHMGRCSHDSCTRSPNFNVAGSKKPAYCKRHSEDGMVNVVSRRCSHDSCTRQPTFDFAGNTQPLYCKQHAEDGMIDVCTRRCSQDSCTNHPAFNVLG